MSLTSVDYDGITAQKQQEVLLLEAEQRRVEALLWWGDTRAQQAQRRADLARWGWK